MCLYDTSHVKNANRMCVRSKSCVCHSSGTMYMLLVHCMLGIVVCAAHSCTASLLHCILSFFVLGAWIVDAIRLSSPLCYIPDILYIGGVGCRKINRGPMYRTSAEEEMHNAARRPCAKPRCRQHFHSV